MKLVTISWYSRKCAVKKASNLLIEQKKGKWYKKIAHLMNCFHTLFLNEVGMLWKKKITVITL